VQLVRRLLKRVSKGLVIDLAATRRALLALHNDWYVTQLTRLGTTRTAVAVAADWGDGAALHAAIVEHGARLLCADPGIAEFLCGAEVDVHRFDPLRGAPVRKPPARKPAAAATDAAAEPLQQQQQPQQQRARKQPAEPGRGKRRLRHMLRGTPGLDALEPLEQQPGGYVPFCIGGRERQHAAGGRRLEQARHRVVFDPDAPAPRGPPAIDAGRLQAARGVERWRCGGTFPSNRGANPEAATQYWLATGAAVLGAQDMKAALTRECMTASRRRDWWAHYFIRTKLGLVPCGAPQASGAARRPTVMVMGDGMGGGGSGARYFTGGVARGSHEQFKRILARDYGVLVFTINEPFSSQVCPRCANHVECPWPHRALPRRKRRRVQAAHARAAGAVAQARPPVSALAAGAAGAAAAGARRVAGNGAPAAAVRAFPWHQPERRLEEAHGLLQCRNGACGVTWQRDTVGWMNLAAAALAALRHEPRPLPLASWLACTPSSAWRRW
jgi:hypothetical protein